MNKTITNTYFSKGDRILATLSPENKDSLSMFYYSGTIHEFEVGEQTMTGLLKLRYISGNDEPGPWFWLTRDGKNAEDKQLYNFIDVIYAPVTTDECPITGNGLLETGTTVNWLGMTTVNWPETSIKAKEPVTVEGEFKVMKNREKVKIFTDVGAQCDEEASGIVLNFDHSLENRIGK